ncbi:thioredoxin H-type-like, partial [Asparagus officinalis]|uniref:thioredoxin H-type-like n=1 Tax=Asparagus officinalis TaxID=4686 RepID=UPI00098E675E
MQRSLEEDVAAHTTGDFRKVVANFSASWCGPCRQITPLYTELSEKYPQLVFLTIDVDELAVSIKLLPSLSLPIYSTLKPPEWQIAFGPVFKCNSTVWRALMMVNPAKEKNQWMVEIDKFTVEVPRVA